MKFSQKIQNLIADFRGLPSENRQSILREERTIGNLLQGILKKYTATPDAKISGEIFEQWPLIVGNLFCDLCTPHKISPGGALIIKVSNSVVRQELFCRKDEILQQIRNLCPKNRIDKIVFSL
jgi:hypothetical protein